MSNIEAVVTIIQDDLGRVLMGRRKDNGKWTLCAGHLNEGEDPQEGAKREIQEETGLKADTLHPISWENKPADVEFFSCTITGAHPTGKNDPDQEVDKWQFIDVREGIPKNIYENLAGPEGDSNIIRQLYSQLDLKKNSNIWLEAGFSDLSKHIDLHYKTFKAKLPIEYPREHLVVSCISPETIKMASGTKEIEFPVMTVCKKDLLTPPLGAILLVAKPSVMYPGWPMVVHGWSSAESTSVLPATVASSEFPIAIAPHTLDSQTLGMLNRMGVREIGYYNPSSDTAQEDFRAETVRLAENNGLLV